MGRLLTERDVYPERPADARALLAVIAGEARSRGRDVVEAEPHWPALVAWVGDGRWLADCPACASGIPLVPERPDYAICRGCFRIWRAIRWPAEGWRRVEDVLAVRPVRLQHWLPAAVRARMGPAPKGGHRDETIAELEAENASIGLPVSWSAIGAGPGPGPGPGRGR